jgi:hypothetical protein
VLVAEDVERNWNKTKLTDAQRMEEKRCPDPEKFKLYSTFCKIETLHSARKVSLIKMYISRLIVS